jgi:hypothetical protein
MKSPIFLLERGKFSDTLPCAGLAEAGLKLPPVRTHQLLHIQPITFIRSPRIAFTMKIEVNA